MNTPPHFKAKITLKRGQTKGLNKGCFIFGENGFRAVPMEMEGLKGLNTVGLFVDGTKVIHEEQTFETMCNVIYEEGYFDIISPKTKFKLWDGDFFADGEVIEVYKDNWEKMKDR